MPLGNEVGRHDQRDDGRGSEDDDPPFAAGQETVAVGDGQPASA